MRWIVCLFNVFILYYIFIYPLGSYTPMESWFQLWLRHWKSSIGILLYIFLDVFSPEMMSWTWYSICLFELLLVEESSQCVTSYVASRYLRIVSKNPWFITCGHTTKKLLFIVHSTKKIKTLVFSIVLLHNYEIFATDLSHVQSSVQSNSCSVKIWWTVNLCKFHCPLHILNVKLGSALTRVFSRSIFFVGSLDGVRP